MAMHSARIEVSGVPAGDLQTERNRRGLFRPLSFEPEIGTARVEGRNAWTARFTAPDASGRRRKSSDELLRLVGTFLLAQKARESETPPVQRSAPDTKVKSTPAERKLSQRWAELSLRSHLEKLDQIIAECRKRIVPVAEKIALRQFFGASPSSLGVFSAAHSRFAPVPGAFSNTHRRVAGTPHT